MQERVYPAISIPFGMELSRDKPAPANKILVKNTVYLEIFVPETKKRSTDTMERFVQTITKF